MDIERPGIVALRVTAPTEVTVTVHRGEATIFGETEARVVRQGQTFALAAGSPIDEGAVYSGRVLPVSRLRADGLASAVVERAPRGFGSVSARVPGTQQVVSGVHLTKHWVRTVIKDGFARTEIEEELFNDTGRVLEGRYQFVLPPGASLSRLALWVGSELVEGEIVERDRGARIFRGIVDDSVRPRDPALLEWMEGSELSLKIFPIEPQRGRRVVVAYNEALPEEGGTLRYRYPLGLGSDRTTRIDEFSISVTAYDTRGVLGDVRTPGFVAQSGEHAGGVMTEFVARGFTPTEDFVVQYSLPGGAPTLRIFVPEWGHAERELPEVAPGDRDSIYFALPFTVALPQGASLPSPPARDRVVVVDRSFSQGEESLSAQVRIARALLEDLAADERFAVLACDSACEAYPAQELAPATAVNVAEANAWLSTVATPGGASDFAGAVMAATTRLDIDRRGQIVVLGDGRATAGELGASAIAQRIRPAIASRHVDLRLLGVGRSVDEVLLSGLAAEVGAAYEQVAAEASLGDRIDALVLALRTPVVEQSTLELPDGVLEVYPRRLPNLRLGQTVLLTGKLRSTTLAPLALRGMLDTAPYRLERNLGDVARAAQNPLVPRLWAERAIAELEASGDPSSASDIVRLSQRHHVLSRRTSLLVLENAKMFAEFGVRRTQGPAIFSQLPSQSPAPGSLLGDDIEDNFGAGGLGLSGIGHGGGGRGIGAGTMSGYGRAAGGLENGQGFGAGYGRLAGSHATRAPRIRMGTTTVSGRIPPEVITRIVRQNYGRFRLCYEQGLAKNAELAGRVVTRFVIGRDGAVLNAVDSGSDLPDKGVVECVVRGLYGLTFPQPEGGIVTVVYPIQFATDAGTGPINSHRSSQQPRQAYAPNNALPLAVRPVLHRPGTERWRESGDSEIARASRAVKKTPESRRAWSTLLSTLLRRGRFDEAYGEGRELARRDPDDTVTHERLAWTAAARGQGTEAARELGIVAELAPRRASAQLAAARAFEAAGDEARACAHWRAAATLESRPGRARFETLRCRARLGEVEGVRRELADFPFDKSLDPLRAALDVGKVPAYGPSLDAAGWFEARVECKSALEKCPVVAIVTPQGRVVSPWTPDLARASAKRVALTRTGTGRYRTLLVGGDAGSRGMLSLVVNGTTYVRPFAYDGGVVTAVESDVNGSS